MIIFALLLIAFGIFALVVTNLDDWPGIVTVLALIGLGLAFL